MVWGGRFGRNLNSEMDVSEVNQPCHRIGGVSTENLRIRLFEEELTPPGISVLIGGSPEQAASDMRRVFGPRSSMGKRAKVVGTAEIVEIRAAGFDVIEDPSRHFPNHGRLIHPAEGAAGFTDENLSRLAKVFTITIGL